MEQRETSYETTPADFPRMKAKINKIGESPTACILIDGVVVIRSPLVFSDDPSVQFNAFAVENETMIERFGEGWEWRAKTTAGYSMTIWKDTNYEKQESLDPS